MIRKVALVQALRETFPSAFGGMYSAEEQGVDEPEFNVVQESIVDVDTAEAVSKDASPQISQNVNSAAEALFG